MALTYHGLCATSLLFAFLFDVGKTNVLKDTGMVELIVNVSLPLWKKI